MSVLRIILAAVLLTACGTDKEEDEKSPVPPTTEQSPEVTPKKDVPADVPNDPTAEETTEESKEEVDDRLSDTYVLNTLSTVKEDQTWSTMLPEAIELILKYGEVSSTMWDGKKYTSYGISKHTDTERIYYFIITFREEEDRITSVYHGHEE